MTTNRHLSLSIFTGNHTCYVGKKRRDPESLDDVPLWPRVMCLTRLCVSSNLLTWVPKLMQDILLYTHTPHTCGLAIRPLEVQLNYLLVTGHSIVNPLDVEIEWILIRGLVSRTDDWLSAEHHVFSHNLFEHFFSEKVDWCLTCLTAHHPPSAPALSASPSTHRQADLHK